MTARFPCTRIKYLVSKIGSGKTPKGGTEVYVPTGIMFLRSQNIHFDGLRLDDVVHIDEKTDEEMYSTRVQPDDVLLNITGASIGRCTAVPIGTPTANVNQHVCILRPTKAVLPNYLNIALQSNLVQGEIFAGENGSSREGLTFEQIGNFKIPLPSLSIQYGISKLVASKTQLIDSLTKRLETLLSVADEKRRAMIASAVTRGLDPSAPLRDSGVPWLGQIPAHWGIRRAKSMFVERDVRSRTGEETLLSLRMRVGLVPHNDVSEKQTRSDELVGYKKVAVGQIVVNRMRAASGLVAVAPQDGLVSPDYAVFEAFSGIDCEYYTMLFRTELLQAVFRSESTGLGTGSSGFLRLYSENFLDLRFPSPPPTEQQQIVEHDNSQNAKLECLRSTTQKTIDLLKKRRAALISAAVTGQLDVGGTIAS